MRLFLAKNKKTILTVIECFCLLVLASYLIPILLHMGYYLGSFFRYVYETFYKLATFL